MSKEIVVGQKAVIEFDASKCIHSRHCVLDRPDVFVPNVPGEWIRPDAATPDEVVSLARNCPSGAIVARRLDGGPEEAAPQVNTVRVLENGPLAVRATLAIAGSPAGYRATLCRCGQSKNKPFCDGSHGDAAFTASGEPAAKRLRATRRAERGRQRESPAEWPAQGHGPRRTHLRHRPHDQSRTGVHPVSLRPLEGQAVLRRKPQGGGLHRRLTRRARPTHAAAATQQFSGDTGRSAGPADTPPFQRK